MKKMKNTRIPELEAEIKQTTHNVMQRIALGSNERINSPEEANFRFMMYHHQFQALLDKTSTILQLKSGGFSAVRNLEHNKERQDKCREVIRIGEDRLMDLENFLKEVSAMPKWKKVMLYSGLAILAFSDSQLNASAIERMMGMSMIGSIATAAALAATIGIAAHSVPKYLDVDYPEKKKRRQIIVGGAALVFFGCFALARAQYGNFPAGSSPTINVLGYTLLSMLLFFGACAVGNALYKGRGRGEDSEAYKVQNEYAVLRREVDDAKAELKFLEEEYPAIQAEAASRFEYGSGLVSQIQSEAKRAYIKFISDHSKQGGLDSKTFDSKYPFEFETEIQPIYDSRKSRNKTASVLALIMLAGATFSCSGNDGHKGRSAVITLADTTDVQPQYPDTSVILQYLGLNEGIWDGCYLEASTICEATYSPSYLHELPYKERIMENLQEREAEVFNFKKDIQASFDKVRPRGGGATGHSVIFSRIWVSAVKLHGMDYEHKWVICFSDLLENSTVNFYDKRHLALLKSNPDSVEHMLMSSVQKDDISGVSILMVYKPKDYADNMRFVVISDFYKKVFEKYGADVQIQATL